FPQGRFMPDIRPARASSFSARWRYLVNYRKIRDPKMTDSPTNDTADTLDILKIMEMIPHRYPLLLVDRLVDIVPGVSATGIKNVTINEPQFTGHFPSRPIMPGVMIVESMAQTAGVLVIRTLGAQSEGKHVLFMSIDNARFRRP